MQFYISTVVSRGKNILTNLPIAKSRSRMFLALGAGARTAREKILNYHLPKCFKENFKVFKLLRPLDTAPFNYYSRRRRLAFLQLWAEHYKKFTCYLHKWFVPPDERYMKYMNYLGAFSEKGKILKNRVNWKAGFASKLIFVRINYEIRNSSYWIKYLNYLFLKISFLPFQPCYGTILYLYLNQDPDPDSSSKNNQNYWGGGAQN